MPTLINLWTQVRKQLRWKNGGTGNTQGWSTGVIKVCVNRTGSTLALNTLVKLSGNYNDGRVSPCSATTDKVLGVVVGYWATDDPDTLILADAPDAHAVAVMTHGTVRVNITGTVTRGQYAFPSTTSGAASSSATIGSGAFGVWQSSGTTGNTALVLLTGTQGFGMAASTSFGTPAIVLGTAAAAGAASTALRTDATIVAFDATTPAAIGTAATGSAAVAARRDHVHGAGGGTPATQAVGDTGANGSGPAAAFYDHRHPLTRPALTDLSDVTISSPATGEKIRYSGTEWVNASGATDPYIWRPLMDGAIPGAIILDSANGEAVMAYCPA